MPSLWTPNQKPARGAMLDWGNPIARGLLGFWPLNDGAGPPSDLVSRRAAVSNGGTWGVGPAGSQILFAASTGIDLGITPALALRGPATYIVCGSPAANGSTAAQEFVAGVDGSSAAYRFACCVGGGTNELNLLSPAGWISSNNNVIDGATHVFGVSVAGFASGQVAFYRDGIPCGTGTASAPTSTETHWYISYPGYGVSGPLSWVAILSRALSAAEHASIAANPWQLIRPTMPIELMIGQSSAARLFRRTNFARAGSRGVA